MSDATDPTMASAKDQKEAFVTGHEGTTPWEVMLVCLSAPIGLAFCQLVVKKLPKVSLSLSFVTEAFFVWFPMILCQSNFLYPVGVVTMGIQSFVIIVVQGFAVTNARKKKEEGVFTFPVPAGMSLGVEVAALGKITHVLPTSNFTSVVKTGDRILKVNSFEVDTIPTCERIQNLFRELANKDRIITVKQGPRKDESNKKLAFLTAYRSSILYLTFIAILAVDFHVFPRRFVKTELYGYGLMDLGAASFCLSAGLVSDKARGKAATGADWTRKHMIHTLPLVLLGLLRNILNKNLEYQEHVSEYGVHWNFFFTMGVLATVPPLFDPVIVAWSRHPTWILPFGIMLVYQGFLSLAGWQEYIETALRKCNGTEFVCLDWFDANREGILGCFGYLALYFLGEWIGYKYLWEKKKTNENLFQLGMAWWALLFGLTKVLDLPVSRRSTNAPFCLWAAAHNVLLLAVFQQACNSVPVVLETVNKYSLIIFLVANLLTGLVNLTVPTLEIQDNWALAIVFGYICTVSVAALLVGILFQRLSQKKEKSN